MKLKKINQRNGFLTNFTKFERNATLRSIDTEVSNFSKVRLEFVLAFRNWYLIAKIGIFLPFSSTFNYSLLAFVVIL